MIRLMIDDGMGLTYKVVEDLEKCDFYDLIDCGKIITDIQEAFRIAKDCRPKDYQLMCHCMIKHAITAEEKIEVGKALTHARMIGDTEGMILALAQLSVCPRVGGS